MVRWCLRGYGLTFYGDAVVLRCFCALITVAGGASLQYAVPFLRRDRGTPPQKFMTWLISSKAYHVMSGDASLLRQAPEPLCLYIRS